MTHIRPLTAAAVPALVDALGIQVRIDGDVASVSMALPLRRFTLPLGLDATLADGRPDTLTARDAHLDEDPFVDGFDLATALHAFGIPGLPLRETGNDHEGEDLLAEALETLLAAEVSATEVDLLRAGVRERIGSLGFDVARFVDMEVLGLLSCATETSSEAYGAMTGGDGADLRDLCRAYPMLAGEITTSNAVLRGRYGLDAFDTMLLRDGLDCGQSDSGISMEAPHPHLLEWLRGLSLRTNLWTAAAARNLPMVANGLPGRMPTDVAGLEAMLKAQGTALGLLSDAWHRDYDDLAEERLLARLLCLADGYMAAGAGWDEVHRIWLENAGQA